jgi:hypothetical protein
MIEFLKKNVVFNNELEKQDFLKFVTNSLFLFNKNYKQYFEQLLKYFLDEG